MPWVRKGIISVLALLCFASLIGIAGSISLGKSIGKQEKVRNWARQSDFYGAFLDSLISQAQEAVDSNDTVAISFQDDSVRQAVQTALPRSIINNAVSTFLDANYDWLEGKTPTPNFRIDLTEPKQAFATQLASGAESRLKGLPACSTAQLLELRGQTSINPFTIDCLPPGVDPAAQAASISQRINQSDIFLTNPVLTANDLDPTSETANSQPYYKQLSFAPAAYRANKLAPLILLGIALLSAAGILFAARRKLLGLRYLGIIFVISGVLLILAKPLTNGVSHKLTVKLTASDAVGQLQSAFSAVVDKAVHAAAAYAFEFGIGFLVTGIILILITVFLKTRKPPRAHLHVDQQARPKSIVPPTTSKPPKRPRLIQ